jgi:hypothetical protein
MKLKPIGNRPVFEKRSRRWWIFSILAHVAVAVLLAQIVFTYPLGQLLGIARPEVRTEKLTYVRVAPPPTEHSGQPQRGTPTKSSAPAPMTTPTQVPQDLPPVLPDTVARAAGGTGTGRDPTGSGLATGVVPRQPDGRIGLNPDPVARVPRTMAQEVDSIIGLTIGIALDTIAAHEKDGKLPEWFVKTKLGTIGLTKDYIQLGKLKIPTALLALTALNAPQGMDNVDARRLAYIRQDIMMSGQRALSEDEFRAAVKRIRERKDRERREKIIADGGKP